VIYSTEKMITNRVSYRIFSLGGRGKLTSIEVTS